MEGYLKPIGGEHFFNTNLFDNNRSNFCDTEGVFLESGQTAIRFIIEEINIQSNEYVLLPDYLCPTMLQPFKEKNISYDMYEVNSDLSINLSSIEKKLNKIKVKAVFFINYFGFYHNDETINYLKSLKERNIIIIEDSVQMLWFKNQGFIGDYVFNSYRKFLPIDGSLVLCSSKISVEERQDNYYSLVNRARMTKTLYSSFNLGKEEDFLNLFEESEKHYQSRKGIYGMSQVSKTLLSKVDTQHIEKKRIENYSYLYKELEKISKVRLVLNETKLKGNIPIGLPIRIENRNNIRVQLRKHNIFCPVHWELPCKGFSREMLTIPIDQRYDLCDMDRFINVFKQCL